MTKEKREVPLDDIKQGPIRHKEGLTPLLEELARAIYTKVGRFVYPLASMNRHPCRAW